MRSKVVALLLYASVVLVVEVIVLYQDVVVDRRAGEAVREANGFLAEMKAILREREESALVLEANGTLNVIEAIVIVRGEALNIRAVRSTVIIERSLVGNISAVNSDVFILNSTVIEGSYIFVGGRLYMEGSIVGADVSFDAIRIAMVGTSCSGVQIVSDEAVIYGSLFTSKARQLFFLGGNLLVVGSRFVNGTVGIDAYSDRVSVVRSEFGNLQVGVEADSEGVLVAENNYVRCETAVSIDAFDVAVIWLGGEELRVGVIYDFIVFQFKLTISPLNPLIPPAILVATAIIFFLVPREDVRVPLVLIAGATVLLPVFGLKNSLLWVAGAVLLAVISAYAEDPDEMMCLSSLIYLNMLIFAYLEPRASSFLAVQIAAQILAPRICGEDGQTRFPAKLEALSKLAKELVEKGEVIVDQELLRDFKAFLPDHYLVCGNKVIARRFIIDALVAVARGERAELSRELLACALEDPLIRKVASAIKEETGKDVLSVFLPSNHIMAERLRLGLGGD